MGRRASRSSVITPSPAGDREQRCSFLHRRSYCRLGPLYRFTTMMFSFTVMFSFTAPREKHMPLPLISPTERHLSMSNNVPSRDPVSNRGAVALARVKARNIVPRHPHQKSS
jgi:hypothetical protein